MARPTAPVRGTDLVGGRGFCGAGAAFTSNGTATSPFFWATPGINAMTFWCVRPNHAGTWLPNWVDDQGTLQPLTTARSISANGVDGITIFVPGDLFVITFTNNDSNAGTVANFYFAEGGLSG